MEASTTKNPLMRPLTAHIDWRTLSSTKWSTALVAASYGTVTVLYAESITESCKILAPPRIEYRITRRHRRISFMSNVPNILIPPLPGFIDTNEFRNSMT